jgi:hypothetical protein
LNLEQYSTISSKTVGLRSAFLQPTDEDTPNRKEAARGGTGEFYREISTEAFMALSDVEQDEVVLIQMPREGTFPRLVTLEKIK